MSPPSPPQASKATKRPGKTNSYRYFSRLSSRFFKPQTPPEPRQPPSPLLAQHSPSTPTQRLCSLRRKSNNYFATLARTLSSSSDLELSERDLTSSDQDRQTQLVHEGSMGNQQSVPIPSDSVHTPDSKPEYMEDTDTTVEESKDTSTTTNNSPIDSTPAKTILQDPPIAMMKRPLPPPQSRNAVREEAKRAREVVDLCSDGEDAVPTVKRAKARTPEVDDDEIARSPRRSPKRMCTHINESRGERMHHGLPRSAEVPNGSGDGAYDTGTGMQIGDPAAESPEIASETPERKEKEKKKLFGTLGATDVSAWANHQILAANGKDAVLETPSTESHSAGNFHGQDGPSEYVTNAATQPLTDHGQDMSNKEVNSMFVDEGYGSFSVPGDDDDDDRVPETEDEFLKQINSLGDWSPFAQNGKAMVEKPMTPEKIEAKMQQMRAKLQQEQEMADSKRRREANLAAREHKAKQTAKRDGGLSVDFLEDVEPREADVDRGPINNNGLSNGVAKFGYHEEHQAPVNGSKPPSIKRQSQASTLTTPKTKPANVSFATQLDFAEKWAKSSTGPNGTPRSAQRCSESAKPSGKPATDTACAGLLNDRNETPNGFIRAPEQQLNIGGSGAAKTSGACDLETRQSIVSQLTPKRKKRQELNTPQQSLSSGQQESCHDQLSAEARLLELRNAPTSGNVSSLPKALPVLRQGGSVLDQLVKKKEQQMTVSAESSVLEQGSQSPEVRVTSKPVRKNHDKRAKDTVDAAEIVLLRMGVPAPVSKEWTDRKKCAWASREETLTDKQVYLLVKCIKKYNVLHNADLILGSPVERRPDDTDVAAETSAASSPASPAQRLPEQNLRDNDPVNEVNGNPLRPLSTARKPDKQFNNRVAAAELVLRNMGFSPSQTANWPYQRKLAWAAEEDKIEKAKRQLDSFNAAGSETGRTRVACNSLAETRAKDHEPKQHNPPAAKEDSDSDESEEEDGWQYAVRWQGTEQPTTLADTVSLNPIVAAAGIIPEESDSEGEEDEVKVSEVQPQLGPNSAVPATPTAVPERYRNRQAPDEGLLRQMQRRTLDDWNDEEECEEVHEYVVKVDTWGMPDYPPHDLLILGSYLDKDKAEQIVRDFISNCKPKATLRTLEIQTVWSNGNFSQKMICDGEVGCRAFVEPKLVAACKYPDLTEKVARRKTYAVLFERTISTTKPDGDGEVVEDIEATTIDDLQVFTTKSLANEEAKKVYLGWYAEHLDKPQDKCWLLTADENLCQEVKELDEEGLLFERKDHIRKGVATDKIKVWVKEMAPKGPRN